MRVEDSGVIPWDIYLMPGDYYFGENVRIKTLLGSCVTVSLWEPASGMGGMCHIVLPYSYKGKRDGRFADYVLHYFSKKVAQHGLTADLFRVGLFGGGYMFERKEEYGLDDIGSRNVEAARQWLEYYGFSVTEMDVGGHLYRHVSLDLWTGQTTVQSHRVSGASVRLPEADK